MKSSNGSIPRQPNLSTQVQDASDPRKLEQVLRLLWSAPSADAAEAEALHLVWSSSEFGRIFYLIVQFKSNSCQSFREFLQIFGITLLQKCLVQKVCEIPTKFLQM